MNLTPYIRHGWSMAAMARAVGRSRTRIHQILKAQGITGADLQAIREARLLTRYDPTQSLRANARRLGVGLHTIYRWRRQGSAPKRPIPPHGTRARWARGCTCSRCVAANKAYMREYMQKRRLRKQG